mmetsp:Transcript_14453/g.25425  ORF Transcript_14453/g.25425 Transcript_14453/m.25425 type:complete len:117 (+) Transcript_14453:619-969(+)
MPILLVASYVEECSHGDHLDPQLQWNVTGFPSVLCVLEDKPDQKNETGQEHEAEKRAENTHSAGKLQNRSLTILLVGGYFNLNCGLILGDWIQKPRYRCLISPSPFSWAQYLRVGG